MNFEWYSTIAKFLNSAGNFTVSLFIVAVVFYLVEKIWPAEKNTKFFKKDFGKELKLVILNALFVMPALSFLISVSLIALLRNIVPYQAFDGFITVLPLTIQVFFGLLIVDLSTYWRHRFTHNHMWRYHAFHHSAEEITWLTGLRLHPVDVFVALLCDTLILYFLGFSGEGIVIAGLISQMYNYFVHSNINVVYDKPLRYILASPHYHRWHHATDKAAYDKNFCSMFSFLDVIFGTYHHPEELPKAYGLPPAEQKKIPPGLFAHIMQPLKKDLKKLQEKLGWEE